MTDEDKREEQESSALEVISLFGGIRPMAHKLDVPVSTVQGWKERAAIPTNRHDDILAAASRHAVDLPAELLKLSDQGAEGDQDAVETDVAMSGNGETVAEEAPSEEEIPGKEEIRGSPLPQVPPPQVSPPMAAPAKSGGSGTLMGGIVLGALILAIGAGGAVLTRDIWLPYLGAPAVATAEAPAPVDISGLESRLASLESTGDQKLGSLEASVRKLSAAVKAAGQGSGADDKALSGLEGEIAKLKARLSGLETSAQSGPAVTPEEITSLSGEQQSLASRLSGVEAEVGGVAELKQEMGMLSAKLADIRRSANSDGAVLLAGLQLRDAVKGSSPFQAQFNAIEALAVEDAELTAIIAPLKPYAATGVDTLEELRAAFPLVASAVVAVERGSDAGDGWFSGAVRRISEVVTVRPVGLVEGEGPGSAVARSEFYLGAGDLAAALKQLDGLSAEAAEPTADWRAEAEARLAVNKALGQVADLLANRLGKLGAK